MTHVEPGGVAGDRSESHHAQEGQHFDLSTGGENAAGYNSQFAGRYETQKEGRLGPAEDADQDIDREGLQFEERLQDLVDGITWNVSRCRLAGESQGWLTGPNQPARASVAITANIAS